MNNYSVYLTESFEEEFRNIIFYIHSILKEPIISQKIYIKILNHLYSLNTFPERYPRIENLKNLNIRKLHIDNYIVIYEIANNSKEIFVLHIFHYNQNYFNIL